MKFLKKYRDYTAKPNAVDELQMENEAVAIVEIEANGAAEEENDVNDADEIVQIVQKKKLDEEDKSHESTPKRAKYLFDIEGILLNSKQGNLVERMKKDRMLLPTNRRTLVQTLVSHMIEKHGFNPPACIKETLASSLVEEYAFLKDTEGITGYEQWFVKGRKNYPAGGSLEDRLRYVRMKHFKHMRETTGTTSGTTSEKKNLSKTPVKRKELTTLVELTESQVKEAITWMKHNEEPKAMLFEYMANTCKQRYNWIKTDSPTTAEILEVYPRLLDPGIVEQDSDWRSLKRLTSFMLSGLLFPNKCTSTTRRYSGSIGKSSWM
ncbi:uncharacterized protein LOC117307440 isoform X2 [Asterias rubens]|nr:uncharacterized protein LOC117307440 isoform X2 [Asterias rubens]